MYYARGGDSFNISCAGEGNAVLLKAGIPYLSRQKFRKNAANNAEIKSAKKWPAKSNRKVMCGSKLYYVNL